MQGRGKAVGVRIVREGRWAASRWVGTSSARGGTGGFLVHLLHLLHNGVMNGFLFNSLVPENTRTDENKTEY